MFGREGRRVEREERSRRGEERKCTTPLPRISPPVSTAADKAERRFSSRSPTTPQLMTRCALPPRQIQPNNTREKDEIAFRFSRDCSRFLNWKYNRKESQRKKAIVFRSLVVTVKLQPALDASLEAKAVNFLRSASSTFPDSADGFLSNFKQTTDESLTNFVQSIVVLISSASQIITTAAMVMVRKLLGWCSDKVRLALVKEDLISQIIQTLNPVFLSFAETVDIHIHLIFCIQYSIWLPAPDPFSRLAFGNGDGHQAVHEAVLQQVLAPSEKYICHLCANRLSIIDGDLFYDFMNLFAWLIRASPSSQPIMHFVLHLPVFLTIPSSLTFIEKDCPIWCFLDEMLDPQQEWKKQSEDEQQMMKTVHRMLRMEGFEDVFEERLRNDRKTSWGRDIVANSIRWNSLRGMNLPRRR
ncbi:hypothetical protein BLNAU_21755 [Blattamonas nauphoetae]|uniref:Uncharacterized protein n=1 Tax=Blattamonas nauphoetae TaxID=2049346 RepID=A0ABQ9WZ91_9EUKA|nr:hypothetical protein BLNAU_21755 [Blattamonas nauphoetae]